jgi:hypothetical protein
MTSAANSKKATESWGCLETNSIVATKNWRPLQRHYVHLPLKFSKRPLMNGYLKALAKFAVEAMEDIPAPASIIESTQNKPSSKFVACTF